MLFGSNTAYQVRCRNEWGFRIGQSALCMLLLGHEHAPKERERATMNLTVCPVWHFQRWERGTPMPTKLVDEIARIVQQ